MRPFRRYLVFAFHRHWPNGGFHDIQGSFDSLSEIEDLIEQDDKWYFFDGQKFSEYQIFDCERGVLVERLDQYPDFLKCS